MSQRYLKVWLGMEQTDSDAFNNSTYEPVLMFSDMNFVFMGTYETLVLRSTGFQGVGHDWVLNVLLPFDETKVSRYGREVKKLFAYIQFPLDVEEYKG